MSLRGIVQRFKTGSYTVTRRAEGTHNDDGTWTPGATGTFAADMAVFPLNGTELRLLAAGERADDSREFFCETELFCSPAAPDVVSYNGKAWGVARCARWQDPTGDVLWHGVMSVQVRR